MDEVEEKDFTCPPGDNESSMDLFNAVAQQIHIVMAEISHIMNFNYAMLKNTVLKEKIKHALLLICRFGDSQGIDLNEGVAAAIEKFDVRLEEKEKKKKGKKINNRGLSF
jgi:hypothetical protein